MNLRHRALSYDDDALDGPGGRQQAELHLSGQWRLAPTGPLSAWLQGTVVGRLAANEALALQDPLRSPMDDFGRQNLRLSSAHVDYDHRVDGRVRWSISAGRRSDISGAGLLLYDGLQGSLRPTKNVEVSGYVGQRANLDRGFINGRNDVEGRLVAKLQTQWLSDAVRVQAGYRFEDLHIPYAGGWVFGDTWQVGARVEAIVGGRQAAQLDLDTRDATEDLGAALRASLEADLRPTINTWLYARFDAQLGTDPRAYGRGGRAPRPEDVDLALTVVPSQAQLGRLFFGASTPHIGGELAAVQQVASFLELNLQAFLRVPLSQSSLTGLRPRVLEVWGGPSAFGASGARVGLDGRVALQDPGEVETLFSLKGDGERRRIGAELYAVLPFNFSDFDLAFRPHAAAYQVVTEGAGARAEGQVEAAGGLSTMLTWDNTLWTALRYAGATTPSFGGTGVRALHEIELAVGGGW